MTDIHPEPQGKCTKAPASRFFSSRSRPFEYGILTILLLTLVSMFDTQIQSALGVPPKPIEISPAGSVQAIHFVGDFGYDTQVDTELQSFLVAGVAQIPRHTSLELRRVNGKFRLCAVDSQTCWRVLGR
jgi:hypothetical protein